MGSRKTLNVFHLFVVQVVDNKFSVEGGKKLALARFQKPEEREMANQLIETCGKEVSAQQGEKCSLGKTVRECFVKHGKSVSTNRRG